MEVEVGMPGPVVEARPYQVELLEKAKKENSIVFLGTGSGKTFIATMMIKENVLSGGKKTVFLVNSVPLVNQQAAFIKRNAPVRVQSFCGADNVDNWNKSDWGNAIRGNDVLVMVHQVFLDSMNKGFFQMASVNLLVVDECHHTIGNSPYVQIFKQHYHPLKELDPERAPRVLALTASVVTSKCNMLSFQKKKRQLEDLLDSKVITVSNLQNLLLHVTQPAEVFVMFDPWPLPTSLGEVFERSDASLRVLFVEHVKANSPGLDKLGLNSLETEANSSLKKYKRYLTQLKTSIEALGLYSGEKLIAETLLILEVEQLTLTDDLEEEMCNNVVCSLDCLRGRIEEELRFFSEEEKLQLFTTDKVKQLLSAIHESKASCSGRLSMIVFVRQRILAPTVAHLLNVVGDTLDGLQLSFIKAGYAVGGATKMIMKSISVRVFKGRDKRSLIQQMEEIAKQERDKLEETLDHFRNGTLNCVVSTAVLEEGMDIQSCNLVVRFDRIQECRSYIQSKGRARAKPSRFCIMISRSEATLSLNDIQMFKEIEKISIESCHNMNDLLEVDDEDEEDDEYDEFFANPQDPLTSARITTNGAVSVVHRYIQMLPTDRFTKLRPYWEYGGFRTTLNDKGQTLMEGLNISSNGVVCTLYMPHLTPYSAKPFVGPECLSKKSAKRHVALIACKRLFSDGFLNDALVPKRRKEFLEEEEGEKDGEPKRGTKSVKSFVEKRVPEELRCQNPFGTNFLYAIVTELSEEAQNLKNKSYKPQDHREKLGVVVGSKLPEACLGGFQIYVLSGVVTVRLVDLGPLVLSEEQLARIREFGDAAARDVLSCVDPWMVADRNKGDLLLVPLSGMAIDLDALSAAASGDRSSLHNCVISPVHRKGENFFVEEVMNLTPDSFLPHDQRTTFAAYYRDKYDLSCQDSKQSLVRVSGADKRHHMFSPIATNGLSKKSTEKDLMFIPELCSVHPFNASLWRQIQMLPFVLERTATLIKIGCFIGTVKQEVELLPGVPRGIDKALTKFEELLQPNYSSPLRRIPIAADLIIPFTTANAGEDRNLERLEVLGDVFLKYSVSLRLFCDKRSQRMMHEGILTSCRSKIVGNKKLCEVAMEHGLENLIIACKLEPHLNFMPMGFSQPNCAEEKLCQLEVRFLEGPRMGQLPEQQTQAKCKSIVEMITIDEMNRLVISDFEEGAVSEVLATAWGRLARKESPPTKERIQLRENVRISDKAVADVVEALIGCYLYHCGQQGALKFMNWLGLDSKARFENIPRNAFVEADSVASNEHRQRELLEKINADRLESTLGYHFREKSFLVEALTHSSYDGNSITESYERLEFLGDAVLDYVISCRLFCHPDDFGPGELTSLRSALVCNNAFASVVLKNDLHQHLLHSSHELFKKIVECQDLHSALSEFDLPMGKDEAGRNADVLVEALKLLNEEECPVLENVEVPKVLGDILESIMGAIFLDSNMNLETVWTVFKRLCPFIDQVIKGKPRNPIAELGELFPQGLNFLTPVVSVEKVTVTAEILVDGKNVLSFKGIGRTKKSAKAAAAKCALRELRKVSR